MFMKKTKHEDNNSEKLFFDYLLAELRMSDEYSKGLLERQEKANQSYISTLSIITGIVVALITTQSSYNLVFILAISAGLVGYLGIRSRILIIEYKQEDLYEGVLRAGLHQYFQKFNPEAFKEYGGLVLLERHKFREDYIKSLWRRISLIGRFGLLHCILIGTGIALLSSILLSTFVQISLRTIWIDLLLPLAIGVIVSVVGIDIMSKKVTTQPFREIKAGM
jgi:hypothetical protein